MDAFSADLMLHVVQFLSAKDLGRFATTSKRMFFLVKSYQRLRGPECVAATSHTPGVRTRQLDAKELCDEALSQLQSKPTLALCFGTHYGNKPMVEQLPRYLPSSTIIVGVSAEQIQSSCQGALESVSRGSLMLLSLPDVTVLPVTMSGAIGPEEVEHATFAPMASKNAEHWKVAMLFATGEFNTDRLHSTLDSIQEKFPHLTVVGGICEGGHVSVRIRTLGLTEDLLKEEKHSKLVSTLERIQNDERSLVSVFDKQEIVDQIIRELDRDSLALQPVEDGIFGCILGGDVPLRSVVSRGVRSLTRKGRPHSSTPFYVEKASFHSPQDQSYMFRGRDAPPYYMISRIQNRETGASYSYPELVREFGQAELLGLRREGTDGFVLENIHPMSSGLNSFIITDSTLEVGTSLSGMNVDLFILDGAECMKDMDEKMSQLKAATQDEDLLGALMFSCIGRGPSADELIPEEMSDARRFANAFPQVPCLGFYALGEIGPMAVSGRQTAHIFDSGKAALQGYTAVFALFIAPKQDLKGVNLDDAKKNVDAFVNTHLRRYVPS